MPNSRQTPTLRGRAATVRKDTKLEDSNVAVGGARGGSRFGNLPSSVLSRQGDKTEFPDPLPPRLPRRDTAPSIRLSIPTLSPSLLYRLPFAQSRQNGGARVRLPCRLGVIRYASPSIASPVPVVAGVGSRAESTGDTCAWMASSSVRRGAARAPPPPDQLASFYKLVDKHVIAAVLCREARDAELSSQAAVQAEALFGDDSLVVASLRMCESESHSNLAAEASVAEQKVLLRRSWDVLLSVIPLLLRRLEPNTLLPGTLREEELDYEAHAQATMRKAMSTSVAPPTVLRVLASTMGYNTLLNAMFSSLDKLRQPLLAQHERTVVESFVLRGLDAIPRTAGVPPEWITGEKHLVVIIEQHLSTRRHGPAFCAAVLRKWRSDAVSNVLRARGVLQTGIAEHEQIIAEFETRQRADIAKHGLRDCALPSCAKTEKTVKEFAGCSGCRSVVYCCLEHQALDWKAHKKACREKEAARLAAEEEADDKAGVDAAAL